MTITKKQDGNKLCIALEGRLDTMTAPELEKELSECLEGINELVFDLEKLDYISSAGLRVLLATHKAMSKRGGLKLRNLNDIVTEVFEVTGFSDILDIE